MGAVLPSPQVGPFTVYVFGQSVESSLQTLSRKTGLVGVANITPFHCLHGYLTIHVPHAMGAAILALLEMYEHDERIPPIGLG